MIAEILLNGRRQPRRCETQLNRPARQAPPEAQHKRQNNGERAAQSTIPILIEGESGVGKELIARAIQGCSDRAGKPFITVNCGAIPENLIESILFGHEKGAFTGAKRKGSIGKILFANEGTLFLDEIGDMPLHLQARLLRVLQERKVNPLGSGREVDVDITVICATNKNLKEMIRFKKKT